MALTESNMIELGVQAPAFELTDTIDNRKKDLASVKGPKGTVIMFICNHCPYVIHLNHELVNIAQQYTSRGIGFVAISSNDVVNYPEDSPEKMALTAKLLQYPFPYLYDEDQSVARAYNAACTPDLYLFDGDDKLYYRGRLDGSRPGNDIPVTGSDLRFALDCLIMGLGPVSPQIPSAGCNIKWKK